MALPKFFGLDIGSSTIKIVQIKDPTNKKLEILKAGSIETPAGAYGKSDDASKKKIADAVKELVSQLGLNTKNVISAVSERDVFSTRIKFSYENDKDIDESAYWAISKVIPVSIDSVNHGFLPISMIEEAGHKQMEAFVIAVEKKIAEHYADIIDQAGLIPVALETEGVAIVRSISRNLNTNSDSMIIDIGSNSTTICIAKGKNIIYSTSIQTGSDVITRSIAQAFNLDLIQSEEYKKTYGMSEKYFEGKIANVITPVIDAILIDVNRALQFYRQEHVEANITSIKVIGDTAVMPGLIPYITKYLGISAEIADPFVDVANTHNIDNNKQAYAVALGLALKTDINE